MDFFWNKRANSFSDPETQSKQISLIYSFLLPAPKKYTIILDSIFIEPAKLPIQMNYFVFHLNHLIPNIEKTRL
jgi:hypothetical protein